MICVRRGKGVVSERSRKWIEKRVERREETKVERRECDEKRDDLMYNLLEDRTR